MTDNEARRYASTWIRRQAGPKWMGGPEHAEIQDKAVEAAAKAVNRGASRGQVRQAIDDAVRPKLLELVGEVKARKAQEQESMKQTNVVRSDSGLSPEAHEKKYGSLDPLAKDHDDYKGIKATNVIRVDSPEGKQKEKPQDPVPKDTPIAGLTQDEVVVELLATLSVTTYGGLRELIGEPNPDAEPIDLADQLGITDDQVRGLLNGIKKAGGSIEGIKEPETSADSDPATPEKPRTPAEPQDAADTPLRLDAIDLNQRYVKAYAEAGIHTVPELIAHQESHNGKVEVAGIAEAGIRETTNKLALALAPEDDKAPA